MNHSASPEPASPAQQQPSPRQCSLRRWSRRVLLLMLGAVLGSMLALHLLPGQALLSGLQQSLARGGLQLPDPHHCDLSYLTASGSIGGLELHHPRRSQLLSCRALAFTPSIGDWLFSDTYVIDHMTMDGVAMNLRLPDNESGTSWLAYINSLIQDIQKRLQKEPAPAGAAHYHIHRFQLNGSKLLLPQASALDIQRFEISGTHLSSQQQLEQPLTVNGNFECLEDAQVTLTLSMNQHRISMDIAGESIPTRVLRDFHIDPFFDRVLSVWKPSGHVDITIKIQITADEQHGTIAATSDDLQVHPTRQAPIVVRNIARCIERVRALKPDDMISYQLEWSQKAGAQTDIQYHFDKLLQRLFGRIEELEQAQSSE